MNEASPTKPTGCPHHVNRERNDGGGEEITRAVSRNERETPGPRTAILLVNHGSRSTAWRSLLLDLHDQVAAELLELDSVVQVRTAFMEYTEPSIASQLRDLDAEQIDRVIIVPLLLTISDHSYDDIPVICGQSQDAEKLAELAKEKIEVYAPKANLVFAPLLDFSGLVQRNTVRRVNALLTENQVDPAASKALVLVGYGSADFIEQWDKFFESIRQHTEKVIGFQASVHAWCGHLVEYSRQPTIDAIESVLPKADHVVVVPILVAYDPMFQESIIGRGIERCSQPNRVLYRPDSILPEPEVAKWVIEIATELAAKPVTQATGDAQLV